MAYTLSKSDRLCGQLRIQQLYREGKHFVCWPLRVTYMPAEDQTQVLVWAPKSIFRHAVDRNHMRRRMREAYRLNRHLLDEQTNRHYLIGFNYIDREKQPYVVIEKAMRKALRKLKGES